MKKAAINKLLEDSDRQASRLIRWEITAHRPELKAPIRTSMRVSN